MTNLLSLISTRNKWLIGSAILVGTAATFGSGYAIRSYRDRLIRKMIDRESKTMAAASLKKKVDEAVSVARETDKRQQATEKRLATQLEEIRNTEERIIAERQAIEEAFGKERRSALKMVPIEIGTHVVNVPTLEGRISIDHLKVNYELINLNEKDRTRIHEYEGVTIRQGLDAYLNYLGQSFGKNSMFCALIEAQFVSAVVKRLKYKRDLSQTFNSNHVELLCELVK